MEFSSSLFLVQETNIHKRKILSDAEIYQRLQDLQHWQIKDNKLSYTHQFQNFVEAINFVNCLVIPAETANHHPDIAISYNQVTINLTTHDVGGLTLLDFELATTISQLIKTWKSDKQCKF
ncbi:MAG: 4a-hydroxytetrahydrobiopterin dehydratase [Okeania sp. SIO2F4]|uniref:4a-hydroxytetrahydrobiopterin dehydratase n=1 Tax=Okeania sp. SIO2F4 TaxID=2607790 RepID=UPI00142CA46E|nr:4a-hydroxytetrahydrobiopterin dehydratase [Okeania sp. SIO2F4]NES04818.1 4a-hydroxytetrahydrobiopterin dehydratase [Okeania sp. SIO2F4]